LLPGLLALGLLGGCASTNNPRDPLEPLNRAIYQVNDALDKVVMKPVATVYKGILPQFVRTGITNFYNNLYDIITALNNLLQGKVGDALSDVARVGMNTTVGLAGFIDVATEIGLERHKEDFGQTLGRWGIASGPYLQSSICARTCSIRRKYSTKRRSIRTSSSATLTCSAAATWSTTAILPRTRTTKICRS
jgi:phospholipid-binding lipoprotein MlaA